MCMLGVIACSHEEYDVSRGVDKEVTLFSDQVSLPVGDIGPLTMGSLLDKSGFRDVIKDFVKEDADGYLVMESEQDISTSWVMLLSMSILNPAQQADVPAGSFSGALNSSAAMLKAIGMAIPRQSFTLYASNPLTEEIAVSGKLSLLSQAEGDAAAGAIATEDFSRKTVAAGAKKTALFEIDYTGDKMVSSYKADDIVFHVPADLMAKDPSGGMGAIVLSYKSEAFLALGNDFSFPLSYDVNDLNLPFGQYRVKEAIIRADVSSELPATLSINGVEVLVSRTDESGATNIVPSEDVSVTTGIRIASGSTGNPAVSPLEIVIRAEEGFIPDISGLRIKFNIQGATGDGDKRLGMKQNIYVNNIRATVSGGITIQGL